MVTLCISKLCWNVNSKDNFQTKTYMNVNMSKYLYHSGIFLTILLLLLLLLLLLYLFGTYPKKIKNKKTHCRTRRTKSSKPKTFYYSFLLFFFPFSLAIIKIKDFLKDTVVFKLECTHWMHFLIKNSMPTSY
jgi:ABC-type Fe3+ transport system permease subunit